MKYWSIIILVFLVFWSCDRDDDDFIRLPSNPTTTALLPNFSGRQYFTTNLGDTIRLWSISSSSSYTKIDDQVSLSGSTDLDFVEVQNISRVVGNDTLGFRFNFFLQTSYEEESITQAKDELTVKYQDQLQNTDVGLKVIYIDTLACASNYCNYTDTLQFYNREFLGVFHTSDPTTNYTLYLNSTYGLIGFRDSANTIYELIP